MVEEFEKPLCGKCLYWQKHQTELNLGVCYRVPPTPVMVMNRNGPALQMFRAMTKPDEACGLWVGIPDPCGEHPLSDEGPSKPTLKLV